jgi:hypothetical protein
VIEITVDIVVQNRVAKVAITYEATGYTKRFRTERGHNSDSAAMDALEMLSSMFRDTPADVTLRYNKQAAAVYLYTDWDTWYTDQFGESNLYIRLVDALPEQE